MSSSRAILAAVAFGVMLGVVGSKLWYVSTNSRLHAGPVLRRARAAGPTATCSEAGVRWNGFQQNVPGGGAQGSCWCGDGDGYCLCTPSLSIDVAFIVCDGGEPMVALVRRKYPPIGEALPGGFVEVGETVEQAAAREVSEELGVTLPPQSFEQVRIFSSPYRDHRRHGAAALLFTVAPLGTRLHAGDDAENTRLYPLGEPITDTMLAFGDHAQMLRLLKGRLGRKQSKLCVPGGVTTGAILHQP